MNNLVEVYCPENYRMRITKEDIQTRFEEYNKMYFGGILPRCKYHLHREKHSPLGTYNPSFKNEKIVGHIWIAYNVDWSEEDLRETIIHEMIHHYVQIIEGHKGGLFGHNWRFKRQCKRIKKEFGITIFTPSLTNNGRRELPRIHQNR